jgi:hypothetical protein
MKYGRLIGKAEAIVATGMPGLYRVIAFMGVQKIYSLGELGHAASAFSIAQILAFFTAIGWASLILVRVPTASDREERVGRFYELLRMGGASVVLIGAGVLLWARFFARNISGLEIVAILVGWTLYQLTRHYFLAQRQYRRVIVYDVVVEKIRSSAAQLLFVAITSPKKEKFINRWREQLGVRFVMGVGGTFDVVAGKVQRAPLWMQKSGLEWFYRVIQEPRRMFGRYATTNTKFLYLAIKGLLLRAVARPG